MEPGKTYLIHTKSVYPEKLCRTSENISYLRNKFFQYISPIAEIKDIDITNYDLFATIQIHSVDDLLYFKTQIPKTKKTATKNTTQVISQQFKSLFSAYSQAYNNIHNRSGRLVHGTFDREIITEE